MHTHHAHMKRAQAVVMVIILIEVHKVNRRLKKKKCMHAKRCHFKFEQYICTRLHHYSNRGSDLTLWHRFTMPVNTCKQMHAHTWT